MQVTTEAASPGIRTRIEVVEPPYMAPRKMPVSMMMPIDGSRPKVSGSSSVMPASGPSPGSTPTMVPHSRTMSGYVSLRR